MEFANIPAEGADDIIVSSVVLMLFPCEVSPPPIRNLQLVNSINPNAYYVDCGTNRLIWGRWPTLFVRCVPFVEGEVIYNRLLSIHHPLSLF